MTYTCVQVGLRGRGAVVGTCRFEPALELRLARPKSLDFGPQGPCCLFCQWQRRFCLVELSSPRCRVAATQRSSVGAADFQGRCGLTLYAASFPPPRLSAAVASISSFAPFPMLHMPFEPLAERESRLLPSISPHCWPSPDSRIVV